MPTAEDCARAWSELHRVSDSVFACVPPKKSIFAWFVPDHYLWVKDLGNGILEVTERATGKKMLCEAQHPWRRFDSPVRAYRPAERYLQAANAESRVGPLLAIGVVGIVGLAGFKAFTGGPGKAKRR